MASGGRCGGGSGGGGTAAGRWSDGQVRQTITAPMDGGGWYNRFSLGPTGTRQTGDRREVRVPGETRHKGLSAPGPGVAEKWQRLVRSRHPAEAGRNR